MAQISMLGKELLQEINDIDDNNAAHNNGKCNTAQLADAACISEKLMRRYINGKRRPSLLQLMRIIATLGPTPERAEHIIHIAGYDISLDGQPENKDYRAIVSLGQGRLDAKNDILMRYDQYIGRAFVRY